eukprot:5541290-Amphidinium_carterae.1
MSRLARFFVLLPALVGGCSTLLRMSLASDYDPSQYHPHNLAVKGGGYASRLENVGTDGACSEGDPEVEGDHFV